MPQVITATLDKDWFRAPVAENPSFELRLENDAIVLEARVSKTPLCVADDAGCFTAGLWQGDCAELFLRNPDNGVYIEVNLSPRGGWWTCAFSAPRVNLPDQPIPLAGVTTSGCAEGGPEWTARIRIPVASLPADLAFDPAKTCGNVTFCLGNAPQRYMTYADLGGGTPDFHRPERWTPLFA